MNIGSRVNDQTVSLDIWLRLCLKTRFGFERLVSRLIVPMYIGSPIDDIANIACFAVFARRKTVSSRADDEVFRQSLVDRCLTGGVSAEPIGLNVRESK